MGRSAEIAKLLLRLAVGGLMLLHGIAKLRHASAAVSHMEGTLAAHHLPYAFGYLVFVGEVIGPVLVLLGLFTRVGAIFIAIDMLFALYLVHGAQVFTLNQAGGYALELQALYFTGAIAIALLGGGAYGVRRGQPRWD